MGCKGYVRHWGQRLRSNHVPFGDGRQLPFVNATLCNGTADLVQWTLTDHLNTVRDIARFDPETRATTVVNHLVYGDFGKVASESNPAVDSLLLFTARPFDPDTGL
jgi:hypothetical protein